MRTPFLEAEIGERENSLAAKYCETTKKNVHSGASARSLCFVKHF